MSRFKLCFVFDEAGDYKPIPYSKLMNGDKRSPEYIDRYFLPLHGYLLEVSYEDYLAYYRDDRRRRYMREESARCGEFSLQGLIPSEDSSRALAREMALDIEEMVMTEDEIERLHSAIEALPEKERMLVRLLYFEGQTERQCAEVFRVSQRTISVRKREVLSKLERILR